MHDQPLSKGKVRLEPGRAKHAHPFDRKKLNMQIRLCARKAQPIILKCFPMLLLQFLLVRISSLAHFVNAAKLIRIQQWQRSALIPSRNKTSTLSGGVTLNTMPTPKLG